MNIALLHYHLKPGGVTNVIKHQIEVLSDQCDILLITGELPDTPLHANTVEIAGLTYSDDSSSNNTPENVATSVSQALDSAFQGGCDLIHVHNPLLAKNKYFLSILKLLQQKGHTLFLQIHDFAEDGRPSMVYNEPYVSNCHYGVINSRDYNILIQSGLDPKGLHLLPNSVDPIQGSSTESADESRILYPVRAIRRKNIGEAILLSLFFKDKTLSITLPPNSPMDIQSYHGWKEFVKKKGVPIEFDSGLKNEFHQLVSSSQLFITTSITEGFGFSFLEPWITNKVLCGRAIPDIIEDFKRNGVYLEHLYQELHVPVSWSGSGALIDAFMSCLTDNSALFHMPINEEKARAFFLNKFRAGVIDMGLLNECFQKKIISNVLAHKKNKKQLVELNPHLNHPGHVKNKSKLISKNKSAILDKYNKSVYKNGLFNIYRKVINTPIAQKIDEQILASLFLNPENFSLLKWCDYVE